MRRIGTVGFHNLRNAEHQWFHTGVLDAFTPEVADALHIGPLRAEYARLFGVELIAARRNPAYTQTAELASLGRRRQELYLYVKQAVKNGFFAPDAAQRDAADRLELALRPFRDVMHTPQDEATAVLTKMVEVLQGAEQAADVAVLGLTDAVAHLKETNGAYNAMLMERGDERYRRKSTPNMTRIRPQVDEAYRRVVAALNGLAVVNAGDVTLAALMDSIGAFVMDMRITSRRRRSGDTDGEAAPPADAPDGTAAAAATATEEPSPAPSAKDEDGLPSSPAPSAKDEMPEL